MFFNMLCDVSQAFDFVAGVLRVSIKMILVTIFYSGANNHILS